MPITDSATRLVWNEGRTVALLLAVVGAAALAGAGVVAFDTDTETVVEETDVQPVSTAVRTSALVTGNTSLYERGERLTEKSVYLLSATPTATFTVTTSVPADRPATVDQTLSLVVQATKDDEAFYQSSRTLVAEESRVTNGTAVSTATLNISNVASELDRTQTEVGTAGTVHAELRLRVAYRTDTYEGELTAASPLSVTKRAYWLERGLADSREHATEATREVPVEPNPVVYGGLALLGVIALAGAGGVVYWRRDLDAETVEVDLVRAQYEEWISNGEFPSGMDHQYVKVDTLMDLVDLAIDSEKRVIHDDRFSAYAVVDGDVVYYFTTEPFAVASWLDG